jgi:hypothetical protein
MKHNREQTSSYTPGSDRRITPECKSVLVHISTTHFGYLV